jgi:hypothetical protein
VAFAMVNAVAVAVAVAAGSVASIPAIIEK